VSNSSQWRTYIKDGNVFVQPATGGEPIQYTKDGDTTNPYNQMQWSPDSKHLVVFHIFPVTDKLVYYVLSSVDSATRGVLKSQPYP
jgi:Tol biopolymer transport system component